MARGLFIKISPCLACIVALGLNIKRPRIESVYVVLPFSPDAARARAARTRAATSRRSSLPTRLSMAKIGRRFLSIERREVRLTG